MAPTPMFLGLDLSIDQFRACLVDENLELVGVECIDFDVDCPEYGTQGGIFTSPGEAYTTPVEMWIKGLDLLLETLHRKHDLSRVKAIGGGAQHALVWWKSTTIPSLGSLDAHLPFHLHFPAASFSLPHTPTSLDTSSHAHALAIESLLGGPQQMAQLVGTSATPSLVAGQMLRVREGWIGEVWARTGRVQFASSFLTSLLVGKWSAMVESEACATGMWAHRQAHWSDQILDMVGGSREEGRRLRGWLGEVDTSGGRRVATVSRYMMERYGLDPDTLVFPFIPRDLATYLSFSPGFSIPLPGDAILNFGPIDSLIAPALTYLPSKSYQILPHPAFDFSSPETSPRTTLPYVVMVTSRNADVSRALVRDMYTKSWSAFDRLVEVVSPGGSIGLDDKLFSFYHLQGDVYPFSHVKGIYRFETGVKVQEFRDLRANPRCLVESQVFSFRVRWATVVSSGVLGRKPLSEGIVGVGGLPGPTPTRLLCTGAASNFPSIVSILADVFNAPVLIPSTQLDAAQVPNEAHRNAPPKGYTGRACIGAAWFARWGWGISSTVTTSASSASSNASQPGSGSSSPVWSDPPTSLSRRGGTPSLIPHPTHPIATYEDEIKRLLNKRYVLSGGLWGRTNVGGISAPGQVGGMGLGSVSSTSSITPGGKGSNPGSGASTPFTALPNRSIVLDEDTILRRGSFSPGSTTASSSFGEIGVGRLRASSTSDTFPTTSSSSIGSGLNSPSTAYTSPDPNSLLSPSQSVGTLAAGQSSAPTPLTPVQALSNQSANDAEMGLVKVAEADEDAYLMYGSIIPEYVRLEGMIVKGVV